VHSNLSPPSKVIVGLVCDNAFGMLTTSEESRTVEWVPEARVLERIAHPAVTRRTRDMMASTSGVRHRSYTSSPYTSCSVFELGSTATASSPFPEDLRSQ
jgi:hypothetical protein